MITFIAKQTEISQEAIKNTVQLLEQDCTIPFIARYRKELTGDLDEVQIAAIAKSREAYLALEKRRQTILESLAEQELLSVELEQQIKGTPDLTVLEDLYLPYKKKRSTKADMARKRGLEPLAKIIMAQRVDHISQSAQRFISPDVPSVALALEGAQHIIAEWINERTDIRKLIRNQLERHALLTTKVIPSEKNEEKAQKYRDYFDWEEPLSRCPSHRLLAILRAEREGVIRMKLGLEKERMIDRIEQRVIKAHSTTTALIHEAIKDSYKRLLLPSLSKECLSKAKTKADATAIAVFAKNLKQLLLGAPLGNKRILALDPGFRTGCKVVCLSAQGDLEHNETIYPHAPKNDFKGAAKKISSLVDAYKIEAIAIGNGTASRETERFIKKLHFKKEVEVFVVNEAGASIYSASKIAREEFPNYDVTVRGAVSIGRRLADPLAELVKIDPKSIGVGQYQHDVEQTELKNTLDQVVVHCVNAVGVNLNTASKHLLAHISGIGPKLAENIVAFRNQNGPFINREQLKSVPRLGEKAYTQSAGFLRIKHGQNPLDDSSVHPESYALVEQITEDMGKSLSSLIGNKTALQKIPLQKYCTATIGLPTLKDIVSELEKPGRDIREKAKMFTFDQSLKTIHDVIPGKRYPGIVNNITNFGCFVDIGIKESGLIHISQLAEGYVSDVSAHVQLNQHLIVRVLDVDLERKRIQLTLQH